MLVKATLVLLPLLAAVHAKNDWSVPCTTGSCSYDLPETNNSLASGSLKIWGNQDAITDITNAADWEILGCNSTLSEQDIRLVCKTDPEDPNSLCNHLYNNGAAEDKIVRLPESCGKSAFARIAKSWVPDDQSIPADVAKRLVRRDGAPPQVKALRLDTNWESANWSKNGMVNMAIQAGNHQGVPTEINVSGSKARRFTMRKAPRNIFGKIGHAIKGAANDVKKDAEKAVSAVENVATKAASAVENVATKAASAVENVATKAASDIKEVATKIATAAKEVASDVEKIANKTIGFDKAFKHQVTFDKENVNLINSAIQCFGESLSLNVDVSANANVSATLDIVAKGTLLPPKVTEFGIVGVMDGPIGGTIDMQADISGFMDSGFIELFSVGIPGLDFPDILEVGPTFKVNAEISGQIDLTMDMKVGVQMELQNATLSFPPNAANKPANSSFNLGSAPMTMNAAADVQFTGSITASLRPSLNLGISVLKGKLQGEVFLAMDASAVATLDLSGSTAIEKDRNGGAPPPGATTADPALTDDGSANATAIDESEAANGTVVDDGSAANSTDDATAAATDSDAANATATDDGSDDTTEDQVDVVDDSADDQSVDSTEADSTDDDTADAAQQVVQQRQAANDTTDADQDAGDATDDTADATISDDASADANATTTDPGADATDDAQNATATTTAASTTTTDAKGDTTTKSGSFGGCVNVGANINVNVGADGDFLGLISGSKQLSLFTKNFNIFTKCFGASKGQEGQFASSPAVSAGFSSLSILGNAVPLRRSETSLERRIDLSCPVGQLTKFPINSGIISSSSIVSTASQLLV